jgi:hypothetical protein
MADPTNANLPDPVIAELWRARIPRENFSAVLSAFGGIPADAQHDLAVRLVNAAGIFHLRKAVEKQNPRPYERRDQLEDVRTLASRLLALLGISDPKSVAGGVHRGSVHPTATSLLTWLYRVAVKRRPETAFASADERLTILIVLLSDLIEAAEQSAREVSTRPGFGGDRRTGELTPEGELIRSIIKLYIDFRTEFPGSGPKPVFDERLRRFVRSGLELAVSSVSPAGSAAIDRDLSKRTTDAAIRGAFQRVAAQIKPKSLLI